MSVAEHMVDGADKRKLPEGWRWARLEAVCKVVSGSTPRTGVSEYWGGDIPWVTPTDLGRLDRPVLAATERRITAAGLASCAAQVVPPGTVIMSSRAPIGHLAVAEVACCTNQGCKSFVPTESVDTWYLYFALKTAVPELKALGSGATFTEISKTAVELFEIPVPPLSEQQHIAAVLNEQMEAVQRARAAAEAQLEAAKALPAAYLRAVFNSPETQRWPKVRLGEILELRKDVVHPRDNPRGAATFVGLEHLESGTGVRTGSVDVEMAELTGRKPRFYKGDIVYGYLRPYLNKVWVAEFDGLCSVDQYVYKVNEKKVETDFVVWFMRSPLYLKRAPIKTTPGQLPRIRTEEVASVEVNLPPLPEQRRVMAVLTEQLTAAERTRKALEEQLDTINKLPAALLRRAFSGEL